MRRGVIDVICRLPRSSGIPSGVLAMGPYLSILQPAFAHGIHQPENPSVRVPREAVVAPKETTAAPKTPLMICGKYAEGCGQSAGDFCLSAAAARTVGSERTARSQT